MMLRGLQRPEGLVFSVSAGLLRLPEASRAGAWPSAAHFKPFGIGLRVLSAPQTFSKWSPEAAWEEFFAPFSGSYIFEPFSFVVSMIFSSFFLQFWVPFGCNFKWVFVCLVIMLKPTKLLYS